MKATTPILTSILNLARYGLSLNGTTQYGAAPGAATLRIIGDLTIEAWVLPANFATAMGIVSKMVGVIAAPYEFSLQATTGIPVLFRGNGTASASVAATAAPARSTLSHIAVTMKGSAVRHFLNGQLNGSGVLSTTAADGSGALEIGAIQGGSLFSGILDEVRIYARALSDAEIADHHAGLFRDERGLVGYWGMDDGSGATATDLSPYGNHAALTGAPSFIVANPYPGRELQFTVADLLQITLQNGSVYRYASLDVDLKYQGNTYTAADLLFTRGQTKTSLGMQVGTMDLTLYATSTDYIEGMPALQACSAGILDGAMVSVDKAIMIDPRYAVVGAPNLFTGQVGPIEMSRLQAKITVQSVLERLNLQLPRNLITPPCTHVLYDDDMLTAGYTATGCGLNKAAFAVNGTVGAISTVTALNCTLAQATGYFDEGYLVFNSGVNSGKKVTVKSHVSGTPSVLTLAYPLTDACAPDDAFVVYPGCDHQQSTCQSKFNNLANFRGFPYVPEASTAY